MSIHGMRHPSCRGPVATTTASQRPVHTVPRGGFSESERPIWACMTIKSWWTSPGRGGCVSPRQPSSSGGWGGGRRGGSRGHRGPTRCALPGGVDLLPGMRTGIHARALLRPAVSGAERIPDLTGRTHAARLSSPPNSLTLPCFLADVPQPVCADARPSPRAGTPSSASFTHPPSCCRSLSRIWASTSSPCAVVVPTQ